MVDVDELDDDQLAHALQTAAATESWGIRAAVMLVVENRSWLYRHEFRRAVEAEVGGDGRLCAWVDWSEIDTGPPASSGELRILQIALSLAGIASDRPLSDLLAGLDDHNLVRVLQAMTIAARGLLGTQS